MVREGMVGKSFFSKCVNNLQTKDEQINILGETLKFEAKNSTFYDRIWKFIFVFLVYNYRNRCANSKKSGGVFAKTAT